MRINTSILTGLLFIIPSTFSYFIASTGLASLIAITVGLFFMITGLFQTNNYRNRNLYLVVASINIFIYLILIYVLFTIIGLNLLAMVYFVAIALILFGTAYEFGNEWKIFDRNVISFNNLGLVVIVVLMIIIAAIQIII